MTIGKSGREYRRGVLSDMGDTTRSHQVVFPTLTKLAQGCVLVTLKIERLCFHFQDRFEIRGCKNAVVHFISAPSALSQLIIGILGEIGA